MAPVLPIMGVGYFINPPSHEASGDKQKKGEMDEKTFDKFDCADSISCFSKRICGIKHGKSTLHATKS